MATSSIFNELTNRLTQNKRHDSGIHNSSENVTDKSDRPNMSRTEDQTDSGRESDQANELRKSKENLDKAKKKGLLSNIKKMFKKKTMRKSKGPDGHSKSDENLSKNYCKSSSEPDITKGSNLHEDESLKKHGRQEIDLMSEPEDLKSPERSRSSLKEAPQYIRSSLRKLRNKSKKGSSANIDEHSTTPKKISVSSDQYSPRDDDVTEREEKQGTDSEVFIAKVKDVDEVLPKASGSVNLNDVSHSTRQIETSAAKDRIRIAPQNRRRPTRFASKKPQSERSGRSSSLSKRSDDDNSFRSSGDLGSPALHMSSKESLNKLSTSKASLSSIGETKRSSISDHPSGLRKTSSLLGSLEFRKSNLFASQELKNNSKAEFDESSTNDKPKVIERSVPLEKKENIPPPVESKKPRPLAKPRHLSREMRDSRSKSMGNLSEMKDNKNDAEITRKTGASQGSMKNLASKQTSSNVSSEFTDILNEFQKSRERIFQKGNLKKRESESESNENERSSVNHESVGTNITRKPGEATFALTSKIIAGKSSPKENTRKQAESVIITNDANLRPKEQHEFVIKTSPPSSPQNKSKQINEKKDNTAAASRNSVELSNISLRKVAKTSDFQEPSNKNDSSSDSKKVSRIPSLKKTSRKDEIKTIESHDKLDSINDSPKISVSSPNTSKESTSKIPSRKSVKAMSRSSDNQYDQSHEKVSIDDSNSRLPSFNRVSLKKVPKANDFHGNDTKPLLTSEEKPVVDNKEEDKKTDHSFGFNRTLSTSKQPSSPRTTAGNTKNEFTFQSRDLVRSKTLPSRDMKQYSQNGPKSPTPGDNESKIPEWVRIAKQKQHDGESEAVEKNSSPAVSNNKPQISPEKPKLNQRPLSIPKMVPPIDRSISPLKQHSKSFNTKSNVSKDTCIVCNKTAYMFEKCEVDNHTLHKTCAKCDVCSRKLNVGAIFINDNKVLCSQHKP